MIPNSSWQGTPLAPDQLFSAGFRDGMNARAPHPQFQDNTHYLKGYAEGCRSTTENPELTAFCRISDLTTALHSVHRWEQDRERLGFGKVALGYRDRYWIVLVTKDLHDAVMPF
ncbi:hypothetical protein [Leptolyngbya sp. FACHB-711]|uniref:hypothetical protein n=1 Tax=Leptolyngbya sp. FACHB-711 TaxID=2692813 RepID=UPI0016883FCE|nr:hypothetical protein [Leptolyngbya sp. FACHB-711]MBD2024195.1 hypothetical protein [Leptolyngbya sp. FACHB-711]